MIYKEDYFASKQAMAKELHNRREIINELYKRINRAIDYNNYFEKAVKEELDLKQDYSIIIVSYIGVFHDTLEEILKGESDE